MNEKQKEIILDSEEFFNFVREEFDSVAGWANVEELAEWAFGSVEDAIEKFQEWERIRAAKDKNE